MKIGKGQTNEVQSRPIYYRVAELLRDEILSGRLRPGDQLPSEEELRERFGVSRVTIRAALKKLQVEGLVLRLNGKGTFVGEHTQKLRQLILVVERAPKEIPHLHQLIMGAIWAGQENGYQVLVLPYEQFRAQVDAVAQSAGIHAGALLLRCRNIRVEDIHYAEKNGVACLLEGTQRFPDCNWLAVDNADAVRRLVDHLYRQGRRRYAVVTMSLPYAWSSFQERTEAALQRLRELGIPSERVTTITLPADGAACSGADPLAALLPPLGERPDAVVCANDTLGAQVLRFLSNHSLRIPDDVAVSGFDDAPVAQYITPNLTTVRQDYFASGSEAVQQLHRLLMDFDNKRVQHCRRLELVIRESTR